MAGQEFPIKPGPVFTVDSATHTYTLGGRWIPSVTDIIMDAGFESPKGDMFKGSAVHKATELYDKGILDWSSVDDDVMGYLMAWIKFREETGFKPTLIEEPLYNANLCFAGRPDRIGTWKFGKRESITIDIKKYSPPKHTALQLAGYDLLNSKKRTELVAVQLNEDGTYRIEVYDIPGIREMFLGLISLFWFKRT